MIKTTLKCRLCGNSSFKEILNLGKQPISSVFPRPGEVDPTCSPLELIKCDNDLVKEACGLVQLKHLADLNEMYGKTYGYFSSISPTMVNHLSNKVDEITQIVKLEANDHILDIGCNDGTLLNLFRSDNNLVRVGIDPSSEKFKDKFDLDIKLVYDFFSEKAIRKLCGEKQFKLITSIAMFYDIDDPISFVKQIHSLLSDDGVWCLELSYLPLLCSQLTYDQICHEHVTYLSLTNLKWILDLCKLKIIDVSFNDLNGGSFSVFATKNDSGYKPNKEKIDVILNNEKSLNNPLTYSKLCQRVDSHRDELIHLLSLLQNSNKKVYGYGASTKGNIVLNYCGISKVNLTAISDRNPEKFGLETPGSRIPIISHDQMRSEQPDYLIVFIWHFRNEVIQDELKYLENGGKLLFILPRLHIVDKSNYKKFLSKNFENLAYNI